MSAASPAYLLSLAAEDSAQRFPDHPAFIFRDAVLTYGDVARRARSLAAYLLERGLAPSGRVGLYLRKCLELPAALYGVLAAGGVYVPIDPAAPPGRLRFILEDCGIRHLVAGPERRAALTALVRDGVQLDSIIGLEPGDVEGAHCVPWSEIWARDPLSVLPRRTELDLAYIIYTSGSTGSPKGLMHTHASGLAYARMSGRVYDVSPEDRLGNHSPLHFDMSTFEYLTGPLHGATTVIIPEETTVFPVSMSRLIESARLTFWYSVPLALVQILLRGEVQDCDCRSLRWVLFGGEPFPTGHLRNLMRLWPHARFSNVYGPAEVNQCAYYHLPASPEDVPDNIPIGRVWENAEGLVVDEEGGPVAAHQPGELLVRSPAMMRGYWNQPGLNQRVFFDCEPIPGFRERFLRTGDLVRDRGDGELLFLGRKDRLVKIRGYRLELDEVEAVLASHPAVAEAAAVALSAGEGEKEIVAAVILREGTGAGCECLRAHAASRLPHYGVPSRISVLSAFPRTGTGKIDRNRLAQDLGGNPSSGGP
ncbi:MAG TPA: amino acid adenylation domain-containing protein [Verrucomicrobiales bacterium]|nr:amino acid adenylation domain-containing protein [Verrucomicrobiales bacterium]